MLLVIAALAATQPTVPDRTLARMVALYDEVCLQTFPIDAEVDALMARKGATPLTPEQVRITLVNDPGRGWMLTDGDREVLIFVEMPPYHACSVRRFTPAGFADLGAYRAVVDPYEASHPDFAPVQPYDTDRGNLHIHAIGEKRPLPTGGAETLYVFDQHINDPTKRAAGQTAVNVRFVHQIIDPGAH